MATMRTPSPEDHLTQAQRHVREGEQRVADQRQRIAQLAADGHDTTDAEALLATLEQTLALMRDHLAQVEQHT
jgi:Fe2+ or Zn2+ uptake regulation protein